MELQSDQPHAGHLDIRLPSMAAQRLPDAGNGLMMTLQFDFF